MTGRPNETGPNGIGIMSRFPLPALGWFVMFPAAPLSGVIRAALRAVVALAGLRVEVQDGGSMDLCEFARIPDARSGESVLIAVICGHLGTCSFCVCTFSHDAGTMQLDFRGINGPCAGCCSQRRMGRPGRGGRPVVDRRGVFGRHGRSSGGRMGAPWCGRGTGGFRGTSGRVSRPARVLDGGPMVVRGSAGGRGRVRRSSGGCRAVVGNYDWRNESCPV